jgi:hypothetical protein
VLFNPEAQLTLTQFDASRFCYVMDDALADPEALLGFAVSRRDEFRRIETNPYPGIALAAPTPVTRALEEVFSHRVRRLFDSRRTLQTHCRLAIVTLRTDQLRPDQWLCHRDGEELGPRHSRQASILYLFKDESLGGTKFYAPKRSAPEIAGLFRDAKSLSPAEFTKRYGIEPGYMDDSNAYFERIGAIPAKWNRIIFYDGGMLHSGHIADPNRLSANPLDGRLTLNGFFTCRRNVG